MSCSARRTRFDRPAPCDPGHRLTLLDPRLDAFINRLRALPKAGSLADERAQWRRFCLDHNRPSPPSLQIDDDVLQIEGRAIPLRWYRPKGGPHACIIYLHGGGWVLGDLDTQDTIAWGLADAVGTTLVSVDYRLAPEHPYPAAFDDSYAVLEYLSDNAGILGIDAARIGLCGDSAGGNLSAAVCLAARDRGGPKIAAQALLYPVMDTDTSTPSYNENADAPMLCRDEMEYYLDAYLGPLRANADPYAMPLRAKDLGNLPPAWVHTAQFDPLRDEGQLFYRRLKDAGTDTEYRCAATMPHSFLRARFECPAAAAEFDALCDFLRTRLVGPTD